MKNRILLLILNSFILLLSCNNKTEKLLSSHENVWYIYDYDKNSNEFTNSNYGYIFSHNHTYKYILYDFSTENIVEYKNLMSDIKEYNNWKVNKDILHIGAKKYTIKNIKYDTLVIVSDNGNKKILVNLKYKSPITIPKLIIR